MQNGLLSLLRRELRIVRRGEFSFAGEIEQGFLFCLRNDLQ